MDKQAIDSPQYAGFLHRSDALAAVLNGVSSLAAMDEMIFWLAKAAREAREDAKRLPVHIAAELSVHPSTVTRFERGSWPGDPDKMLRGYAEDLDVSVFSLWERAVSLWRESLGDEERDLLDQTERETAELLERERPTTQRGGGGTRRPRASSG